MLEWMFRGYSRGQPVLTATLPLGRFLLQVAVVALLVESILTGLLIQADELSGAFVLVAHIAVRYAGAVGRHVERFTVSSENDCEDGWYSSVWKLRALEEVEMLVGMSS